MQGRSRETSGPVAAFGEAGVLSAGLDPSVSVVIPVYDDRERLDRALAALARQDAVPGGFEVLVVDDGSEKRLDDVVAPYPFARLLRQRNQGPAAARNCGAFAASSPIVAFVDADCVPSPSWLRELIQPFEDPSVTGVQGHYVTRQRSLAARFVQLEIEQRYALMKRHSSIDMVGTYSAAFRRAAFVEAGGFDTSFRIASGEDMEFSFRLHEAGHRLVLAEGANVAHDHPDSVMRYARQKYGRAYWRYLLYKKHPEKIVRDSYTPQGLKVEVGLMGLAGAALALGTLLPGAALLALIALGAFSAVTLPFATRVARKDAAVAWIAPAMLAARSTALFAGLLVASLQLRNNAGRRELSASVDRTARGASEALPPPYTPPRPVAG